MAAEAELPQLAEARAEILSTRERRRYRVLLIVASLFLTVTVIAVMAVVYKRQAFFAMEQAQYEARALYLASPVVAVGPRFSISARGWLVEDGRPVSQISEGPVTIAIFSPDKRLFAAADREGVVVGGGIVPEPDSGREIVTRLPFRPPVTSLGFSPDGTRLVTTGGDGTVSLWEVQTGQEIAKLETRRAGATTATFSPDAALCALGKRDGSIVLWSTADSRRVTSFQMQAPVKTIAFSADQHSLLVGFESGGYAVIAVADGKQIASFPG